MDFLRKTLIVIPARLSSTRLEEKLLKKIHGREIIVWVAQRIATLGIDYVIAIDDMKIAKVLQSYELPFVLTSNDHISGTSRVSEVAELMPEFDFYCSVQGDEPLIDPAEVLNFVNRGEEICADYLNAVCNFSQLENPTDDSNVKAIVSSSGRLIYASRAKIPFTKNTNEFEYMQICGLYFFSRKFILEYKNLPASKLEDAEKIEQLRCLEQDIPIDTYKINGEMLSVDTEEDFKKIEALEKERFTLSIL